MEGGSIVSGFAPDNRTDIAGQGQDRQWTRRHEELVCDAVMRVLMFDRTDQRGLAVSPARTFDPRPICGAAAAPVRADQHAAGQGRAVVEVDCDLTGLRVLCLDRPAGQMGDPVICRHRVQQRAAQVAVLDHVTHRAFLDLGVIEMHEKGCRPLARAPV